MVDIKVEGTKMIITADLTGNERSKSGKSIIKATTNGFVDAEGTPYRVSLNVITK
jgi:hypothetical protein